MANNLPQGVLGEAEQSSLAFSNSLGCLFTSLVTPFAVQYPLSLSLPHWLSFVSKTTAMGA